MNKIFALKHVFLYELQARVFIMNLLELNVHIRKLHIFASSKVRELSTVSMVGKEELKFTDVYQKMFNAQAPPRL